MSSIISAVIDTNVIVSALITKDTSSPTVRVVECIFEGLIVPVVNAEILREYRGVLLRPKFRLDPELVEILWIR